MYKIKFLLSIGISLLYIFPFVINIQNIKEDSANYYYDVKETSSGASHSLMISQSGDLYTWGRNAYGQLGHGNTIDLDKPKRVESLDNVKEVFTGYNFSGAITESGDLYTWGSNANGQLGLGYGEGRSIHIPKKVSGLSNVKEVSMARSNTAAITNSGDLYTWGFNGFGKLGHGNGGVGTDLYEPKKVSVLNNVKEVSTLDSHSAAITESGDLYTWGDNDIGQLGHGNKTDLNRPKKVSNLSDVTEISLGGEHSAAISQSGDLYTWGYNGYGQLGHGNIGVGTHLDKPKKVSGLSNLKEVSSSDNHSAAITESGDLYTWGRNIYGQLGHGNKTDLVLPKKVSNLSDVKEVSLGNNHSSAITESGDLYTWGDNTFGQLGHGNKTDLLWAKKHMELFTTINVKTLEWSNIMHPTWHGENDGYISFIYNFESNHNIGNNVKGKYTLTRNEKVIIINEPFDLVFNEQQEVIIDNLEKGEYSIDIEIFDNNNNNNNNNNNGTILTKTINETITLTQSNISSSSNQGNIELIDDSGKKVIIFPKDSLELDLYGDVDDFKDVNFVARDIRGELISESSAVEKTNSYTGDAQITYVLEHNEWALRNSSVFLITLEGMIDNNSYSTNSIYEYEGKNGGGIDYPDFNVKEFKWSSKINPTKQEPNSGEISFVYEIEIDEGITPIKTKAKYTLFKNSNIQSKITFDLVFNKLTRVIIPNLDVGDYYIQLNLTHNDGSSITRNIDTPSTLTESSVSSSKNQGDTSNIPKDGNHFIFNVESLKVELYGSVDKLENVKFVARDIAGELISLSKTTKHSTNNQSAIFTLENKWNIISNEDFFIDLEWTLESQTFKSKNIFEYNFDDSIIDNDNTNFIYVLIIIGLVMLFFSTFIIIFLNNSNNKKIKSIIRSLDLYNENNQDGDWEEYEYSL